jgi:hypothetical protein
MCGIYGAIAPKGRKYNLGIINALTWANRERGTDSCGFFDSTGRMTKRAGDPSEVIRNPKVQIWLKESHSNGWFIAGHTRLATRGAVNRRNSHPFRYGRIIGSHNGIVNAPDKFTVDSEYIFWALNKAHGDYQSGLEHVGGYWGLSWFDGKDFYLMSHHSELSLVEMDGIYYYSSSWKHLDSCTGGDSTPLGEGEVWKFSKDGRVESSASAESTLLPFISRAFCQTAIYSRSGYSSPAFRANRFEETRKWWAENDEVKDYDSEWSKAWEEYCGNCTEAKSIHEMSDDEFNATYAG